MGEVDEAYFRRDFERVRSLAASIDGPVGEVWAGFARWMQGDAAAEASLVSAFSRIESESLRRELASVLLESTFSFGGNRLTAARLVDRLGVTLPIALRVLADELERTSGNPVEAFRLLVRAKQADPSDPETDFALARLHARGGRAPKVVSSLEDACRNATLGQDYRALARRHPDFKGLETDPAFVALVETRPTDPTLASLARKLDDRAFSEVADAAAAQLSGSVDPLFVLEAWREAVDGLMAQVPFDEEPPHALVEAMQHVTDQLRSRSGQRSEAWTRFRPASTLRTP